MGASEPFEWSSRTTYTTTPASANPYRANDSMLQPPRTRIADEAYRVPGAVQAHLFAFHFTPVGTTVQGRDVELHALGHNDIDWLLLVHAPQSEYDRLSLAGIVSSFRLS